MPSYRAYSFCHHDATAVFPLQGGTAQGAQAALALDERDMAGRLAGAGLVADDPQLADLAWGS